MVYYLFNTVLSMYQNNYMFPSTGTINHYYIYPNKKHWNFFFAIAELNVTIPNELEHHGLEIAYPNIPDSSK